MTLIYGNVRYGAKGIPFKSKSWAYNALKRDT